VTEQQYDRICEAVCICVSTGVRIFETRGPHLPGDAQMYRGAEIIRGAKLLLAVLDEEDRNREGETMETLMPLTARDALTLWDAGGAVPAFQVETAPERQTVVYAAAFEILRATEDPDKLEKLSTGAIGELSERESDVARSIAAVAQQSGWAKMVSQHVHRDSPAITVTEPKE